MLKALIVIIISPFVVLIIVLIIYAALTWNAGGDAEPLNLKRLDGTPWDGKVGSTIRLILEVPKEEGNEPFNKENWLHGKGTARAREIKKLIKQRLLQDKSMEEIKQLLGAGGKYRRCYYRVNHVSCYFGNGGISDYYDLSIEVQENAPNEVYIEAHDPVF